MHMNHISYGHAANLCQNAHYIYLQQVETSILETVQIFPPRPANPRPCHLDMKPFPSGSPIFFVGYLPAVIPNLVWYECQCQSDQYEIHHAYLLMPLLAYGLVMISNCCIYQNVPNHTQKSEHGQMTVKV
jgi:hypothetical protein